MKAIDLTGMTFERLTVVRRADTKSGRRAWFCICSCGNSSVSTTSNLRKGWTKSCGCLRGERLAESHKTHGKAKTPIYMVWRNMRSRCENKNVRAFKNYGGRGITVCERWKTFENFYADMGDIPLGKTLERKDNSGNYEPTNCRWATPVEQGSNTRKTRFLTHAGKTQNIAAWARETGIKHGRIWLRIASGWSVEKALTTPIRKMKRKTEWRIPARI